MLELRTTTPQACYYNYTIYSIPEYNRYDYVQYRLETYM